jgi:hypothetical protein
VRIVTGVPSEALTTPTLLSQRERREKGKTAPNLFFVFIPLSPSGREGSGE